jgi:uncharacterized ion transporter superfamily protein YfcC
MKLRFPHTYVIIFSMIILAAILTWVFPGGDYVEEIKIVDGKEVKQLVFHQVESSPQTWQNCTKDLSVRRASSCLS